MSPYMMTENERRLLEALRDEIARHRRFQRDVNAAPTNPTPTETDRDNALG